ncbi:MAG: hypothetical protein ABJE47_14615 [bacterium]
MERTTVVGGARFPAIAACLLLAVAACERPTAPTVFVYADRPIVVAASAEGWRSVTVGGGHTCAIRVNGAVYCWGANASGQLGVGAARGVCGRFAAPCEGSPRATAGGISFTQVSAGQRHTCGISETRALYCWGENFQFQSGVEGAPLVATPTQVMPGVEFVDVGSGGTHSCAVRADGVILCFGEGTLGALGKGDTVSSVRPMPIGTAVRFSRVRSGRLRSCGISVEREVWCWGSEWESNGGGFDFFHQRLLPHRIDGIADVRDISVSGSSLCAITTNGNGFCWESNAFGQLGNGGVIGSANPASVSTEGQFTDVSAGIIQSCGTVRDGRVLCWGNNSFGQLGVPRPGEHCGLAGLECSTRPIGVFGGQRFVGVATGLGNHTCGVTVTTAILCWGLGSDGQLGDGYTRDRQSLPVGVLAPLP